MHCTDAGPRIADHSAGWRAWNCDQRRIERLMGVTPGSPSLIIRRGTYWLPSMHDSASGSELRQSDAKS